MCMIFVFKLVRLCTQKFWLHLATDQEFSKKSLKSMQTTIDGSNVLIRILESHFLVGNLTGVAQDLLHYFDTRSCSVLHTSSQQYSLVLPPRAI